VTAGRRRARERGVSLIEILVAITLFAITATGMTALAVQGLRRTAGNRSSTGAVIAAQHELEDLRSLAYVDVVPRAYGMTIAGTPYGIGTAVANDTPASGMKQITVTINWSEQLGPQSYVLRTILTQIN
jgi:prepilin-type N-terminal cleavage/methylation domain-containing protein